MTEEGSPEVRLTNMKLIKKALGRLAACAVMVTVALAAALPASAQIHYRGFVEGGIGVTTVSGESESERFDDGGGVAFGYSLATTHGIQLKKHFIGLGFGIAPAYCAVGGSYSGDIKFDVGRLSRLSFPVYANWRYDFFNEKEWNPYVGVKAGLFLPFGSEPGMEYSYKNGENTVSHTNSWWTDLGDYFPVYVALDFGFRKKISPTSGISLGLTLQTAANASAHEYTWGYDHNYYDVYLDNQKFGLSILAKIAFDF